MTVRYSGSFLKLLFRWKGSVWKAVWKELLVFLALFYIIRLILFKVVDTNKDFFSKSEDSVVKLFQEYTLRISIEFLVSFYVSQVVARWWAQVQTMPWPDDAIALFNAFLPDANEENRLKRLTMTRYVLLSFIIALREISSKIKQLVPKFEVLIHGGLLNHDELALLENMPDKKFQWELPLQWIQQLARTQIGPEVYQIPQGAMGTFVNELNKIRSNFRQLFSYHWVCLPLIYTQTATIVVYGYFLFALVGYQHYNTQGADIVVPCLIILRFIVCVGWLKVAEQLWKPFGDDDEDVELTKWLERHIRFSFTIADYAQANRPTFTMDMNDMNRIASIFNVSKKKKNVENALFHITSVSTVMSNNAPDPVLTNGLQSRRRNSFTS